jgi:dihydrolipoamide dehydrogenase
MPHLQCDVAIIGAGTAGLVAERSARRRGAKTLLIDDQFAGTTCTTAGCMPSKLLIAAAAAAHAVRRARIFGISAQPEIDGRAVMDRLRKERDRFVAGVQADLAKLPEGVKHLGRAAFTGPTTLKLDDGTTVSAKAVVIATGSRPSIPPALRDLGDRLLTNETIFELPTLPSSVAVVGAGPLGLELAQALARLGVRVELFDKGDTIAGLEDAAVEQVLTTILEDDFSIHLGVDLAASREADSVTLYWTGDSEGEGRFDYLLVAAGRPPQLDGLGLGTTGLDLDEHGLPSVDPSTMQCGSAPIFMAGDVDHARPVLHEAQAEGNIAGRNAAAYPHVTRTRRMVPLAIMFTDPSMAVVGTMPKAPDEDFVCGSAFYEDQGRAKVFATNRGLVNIYADRQGGRLTAAVMVGPAVEHSAHLLAWAMEQGMTASEVLDMPFYHPTYEEGLKPAFRSICKAVSAPASDRDDGFVPGT